MSSRENFIRLAEQRVNKCIKILDLIGNLSNRTNYTYSEEDVVKIIKSLQNKIKQVESRFEYSVKNTDKNSFKL